MAKQNRSAPVMQAVLDAVGDRLMKADESLIRIPEICEATGVNYGSVYHHFGSREGVIDAAYHQMFSKLAEEDLAVLQLVSVSSKTFEEYLIAMQGLIGTFASSDLRRARRKVRTGRRGDDQERHVRSGPHTEADLALTTRALRYTPKFTLEKGIDDYAASGFLV